MSRLEASWSQIEESFLRQSSAYEQQHAQVRQFLKGHEAELSYAFSQLPKKGVKQKVEGLLDAGAWLQQYGVESCVGVGLMMLAEALLRLPDKAARRAYIQDIVPKMHPPEVKEVTPQGQRFAKKIGHKIAWNRALTDGLMQLGSKWLQEHPKSGQAFLETAMIQGLGFMSGRFVSAQSVKGIPGLLESGGHYSFDMLGEAALTQEEAREYEHLYHQCLDALIEAQKNKAGSYSMSVKLTALYPLFECSDEKRGVDAVSQVLWGLLEKAQKHQIMVTVDAEEAARLRLMLLVVERMIEKMDPKYKGFGCAVQANLKSAHSVLQWLKSKSTQEGKRLSIRLVKGAYWDGEVKAAVNGGYEHVVWESKEKTDQNYLVCAQTLLEGGWCYPMFGTHNIHTILSVKLMGEKSGTPFEFQRLEGMGEFEYQGAGVRARIYAPIGKSAALLPYLARRMLENGSGNSMLRVQQHTEKEVQKSPFEKTATGVLKTYERVFEDRCSAYGDPLWQKKNEEHWAARVSCAQYAVCAGYEQSALVQDVLEKTDVDRASFCERQVQSGIATWVHGVNGLKIGIKKSCPPEKMQEALKRAKKQVGTLCPKMVHQRLKKASDLLQEHKDLIVSLIMLEGGKVLKDALGEWREAFDFCEFHALEALKCSGEEVSRALVGEQNKTLWVPRGVALCISPWNFGFAICMGQVTGALAAGCPVLVKGSSYSALSAQMVVHILNRAGFEECQSIVCSGAQIQEVLRHVDVCAFTGSTAVSVACQKFLLEENPACKWIAETGGFNIMLVEASAHLHFAVSDVIESAFNMAGQRCSALRCVWVDARIAPDFMRLLKGALEVRKVQNPLEHVHAQFGPLIHQGAVEEMAAAQRRLEECGARCVAQMGVEQKEHATYVGGVVYQVDAASLLKEEVFAPLLQVYAYESEQLLHDLSDAQKCMGGYGLTFGVQTRRPDVAAWCARVIPAGNIYINRPMISAQVGVQPFGGMGLSGTGPKIGGTHYVQAFCHEKTISHNTAVYGGARDVLSHNVQYLHDQSDGAFPW